VISAVRDLNRLELAGESVRACLEALAAVAPSWLASVIDVPEWAHRYGSRIDSWRLPASTAKRDRLASVYGSDAVALLRAVLSPAAPGFLAEVPAVGVLRTVLLQNYYLRTDAGGREVIKRWEADTEVSAGQNAHHLPYDTDARWAAKGDDLYWNGYKVHLTETCHDPDEASQTDPPTPNLITNVTTTASTVPDVNATTPIHQALHERDLTPGEHYLDSGYPSAQTITTALGSYGITLVTPALLDYSAQARAGTGFDKTAFTIDWDARQATCPQATPAHPGAPPANGAPR
jgi:hypothetical protein